MDLSRKVDASTRCTSSVVQRDSSWAGNEGVGSMSLPEGYPPDIRDVEGPKKTESMETRLEAMEQQVFKCQGMVERGLNANHMMITEFTNKHSIDANDIGKHLSRLYDKIHQLQAQIYDL
ncbi:40S ribosomal protein S5-1 [Hordeum vulgare]|nr:40S ribosomal protein S5-1 [Hordeum vulgare]